MGTIDKGSGLTARDENLLRAAGLPTDLTSILNRRFQVWLRGKMGERSPFSSTITAVKFGKDSIVISHKNEESFSSLEWQDGVWHFEDWRSTGIEQKTKTLTLL